MLDLLRILLRWRRPLLVWSVLAALVAGGVSFTLTPRYYAQASILPPHDNPGFGGISMLLQQYAIPIPGGVGTPFLPTLYASIVRSRDLRTRILEDFDLRAEFGGATLSEDLETLRARTFLQYTDEGILLVGYQDTDAKRAAEITNAFVRYLDEFIQKVNSQRAGDTRVFIEGQVQRCSADLAGAEEALRDFQKEHRAIEIDAQTTGAVEIAAQIQVQILSTEVELEMLRQHATADAHEVQAKESQLRILRERYRELLGVDPGSLDEATTATTAPEVASLFPQFRDVPDLALQYARLLREVKVQMTLYAMLLQQLEQARIEEAKNTRVLSVLDWAVPGDEPVYPRRMRITAIAALAAFFWVALFAVFVEKLRERREDALEARRLDALQTEWQRMPDWVRKAGRLVTK